MTLPMEYEERAEEWLNAHGLDFGAAHDLAALLREAREQGVQAERERAVRLIGRIQGERIASSAWRKCCNEILRRLEAGE